METYHFFSINSPNVYRRKNSDWQYITVASLLFALAIWFFLIKGPQTEAYIFAGIMLIFGCIFLSRTFSSLVIDINNQTIIQKPGLLSAKQKIAFSDIQHFSISNRIYVLILISSAYAIVTHQSSPVLLGQSFMNSRNSEVLLLETEKIMGRR